MRHGHLAARGFFGSLREGLRLQRGGELSMCATLPGGACWARGVPACAACVV